VGTTTVRIPQVAEPVTFGAGDQRGLPRGKSVFPGLDAATGDYAALTK
jgi:hypothetical protein